MSPVLRVRVRPHSLWLALPLVAGLELVGHLVVQARVVGDGDWAAAAAVVREGFRPGDVVASAPGWTDPLLRHHLGDLLDLNDVGRSDLAGYERLWALSIRGHRPVEAPPGEADVVRVVGPVTVLRWDLAPEPVLYDFLDHLEEASVSLVPSEGAPRPCRFQRRGRPSGGGLGRGPITPAERFVCPDRSQPWVWVGRTTQDTLELEGRRCIWQHPARDGVVVRTEFPDVPLGDRLVLYGGLYYEHERDRSHGPVIATVWVEGTEVGRLVHRDGDGWKRVEALPRLATDAPRGRVTIEVSAPDPDLRTFCWAASTRAEAP